MAVPSHHIASVILDDDVFPQQLCALLDEYKANRIRMLRIMDVFGAAAGLRCPYNCGDSHVCPNYAPISPLLRSDLTSERQQLAARQSAIRYEVIHTYGETIEAANERRYKLRRDKLVADKT